MNRGGMIQRENMFVQKTANTTRVGEERSRRARKQRKTDSKQ